MVKAPAPTSSFQLVGNTPLVLLRKASELTGCKIYGKCEFMNPGGSVKDRPAWYMVQQAKEQNLLKPGGTIVDGTAGNTGIGLALAANYFGYQTTIVIPRTQTEEKKSILRACGARLLEVDAVPYKDPNNYVKYAGRVAEELNQKEPNSAYWTNQFDNTHNRMAHQLSTGPEIWQQTDEKLDGFICAIGTGGTLSGVSQYLRSASPSIAIGLADPHGAALHSYFTTGELKAEGSSVTEGIGQGRITKNIEGLTVDHAYRIDDTEALNWMFDLIKDEGLFVGSSSGINVAGAVRLAKTLGPGHTIATILCDTASRYLSKLFNREFLQEKNLPNPEWI